MRPSDHHWRASSSAVRWSRWSEQVEATKGKDKIDAEVLAKSFNEVTATLKQVVGLLQSVIAIKDKKPKRRS